MRHTRSADTRTNPVCVSNLQKNNDDGPNGLNGPFRILKSIYTREITVFHPDWILQQHCCLLSWSVPAAAALCTAVCKDDTTITHLRTPGPMRGRFSIFEPRYTESQYHTYGKRLVCPNALSGSWTDLAEICPKTNAVGYWLAHELCMMRCGDAAIHDAEYSTLWRNWPRLSYCCTL